MNQPTRLTLRRRAMLAAAPAAALLRTSDAAAQPAPSAAPVYTLPALTYDHAALEPIIGRETMVLHHDKHHQAYVDGLNKAMASQPALQDRSLPSLLADLQSVPEPVRAAVRNNGGGHLNHVMFWQLMHPGGTAMPPALQALIEQDFGSVDAMKARFEEAGLRQFGSGWVFLAYDPKANRTEILTTPNQDTIEASSGKAVLLGNDVWEHAYYLDYRNRRAEYLRAWWSVTDWAYAGRRLDALRAGKVPS